MHQQELLIPNREKDQLFEAADAHQHCYRWHRTPSDQQSSSKNILLTILEKSRTIAIIRVNLWLIYQQHGVQYWIVRVVNQGWLFNASSRHRLELQKHLSHDNQRRKTRKCSRSKSLSFHFVILDSCAGFTVNFFTLIFIP